MVIEQLTNSHLFIRLKQKLQTMKNQITIVFEIAHAKYSHSA